MKIVEELGRIDNGGFGNVDKILCEDGKEYARKTFSVNIPHDESLKANALKRFKREAIFQETLKHRNIVPILYMDLSGDAPYYIMPLAEIAVEKIEFSQSDEYMRMILDVLSGLEEMHIKGFFHRDLKPGNILRFRDGDAVYYAIGDFGLLSIDQTKISDLTPVSMRKSSDYYTAPEIVKSMKLASVQSDVFSVGCLMHDQFGQKSRIPCQPINESSNIGKIMLGCTHKSPVRRFSSIELLREVLISISIDEIELKSEEGKRLRLLFESDGELTLQQWEQVIDFLSTDDHEEDVHALFEFISAARIRELIDTNQLLADSFGRLFSDWIRDNSFDFSFCDALGRRLYLLIKNCTLNTKSECIIAMLYLGTSHNRFYVEELCYEWLCTDDDDLAERLSIEITSEGKKICNKIDHLQYSINVSSNNFHPRLKKIINKLCI